MGFPILTLDIKWNCKIKKSVANSTTKLGDNYQQVAILGTNPITETWDIVSPALDETVFADVISDLEVFSGDTVFYWSPDETQYPLRSFTCDGWVSVPIGHKLWSISGTLTYEPSGQCLAYANLIDVSAAIAMAESAASFMATYTRDTSPFIANAQGVNRNNFHDVLGRGGYLPPSSGTTEGQATFVRALLRLRDTPGISNATKTICLNLASLYGEALLSYFYPISLPNNGNTFYPPHWVINAGAGSFVTKGIQSGKPDNYGHFGITVSFASGVGTIPSGATEGDKLADVYRVYKPTGKLTWRNVYSGLIDETDNLPVNYWVSDLQLQGTRYRFAPDMLQPGATPPTVTTEPAGKIVLTGNYTGSAIVVYSSYTGATVSKNQRFDAFPMWRPCLSGESNAAFDTFWWLWDAYDELHKATNDARWQRARDCTKHTAIAAATIQNESYLFKRDTSTTEPFSYPGTQLVVVNNSAGATVTRVGDGGMLVTVANGSELYPSAELQNFVITTGIANPTTITAELASSVDQLAEIVVSIAQNPLDQSRQYTAWQPLPADITNYTSISLTPGQFVKWPTQTVWHSTNSDTPIYTYNGGGGTAAVSRELQIVDGLNKLVSRINLSLGGGYAGAGFVLQGQITNKPPAIYYKATGSVRLRVIDSNAVHWEWILPPGASWMTFAPDFATATSTATVPGDGLIQAVQFEPTTGSCEVSVYWLGAAPESLPFPTRCYKHAIVTRFDGTYQFKVGNVQAVNSSLNALKYQPAAVPFTANTTNGVVDAWRGTLVAGYQSPSAYLKWGYADRYQQILQCLNDSQAAYSRQSLTGSVGAFAPAYLWNLWSENVYGKPVDSWGWDAPDPNTEWGQYAYRALDSVAEAWYLDKTNVLAQAVTMRFIGYLDKLYRQNNSGQPPTNIKKQVAPQILYHDPAAAAIIMRAAIHANLAGGNPAQTFRVIKRSWEYLQNQYVSTGVMTGSFAAGQPNFTSGTTTYKEYFGFWQAEIIESLALLIRYKEQLVLPACSEQV